MTPEEVQEKLALAESRHKMAQKALQEAERLHQQAQQLMEIATQRLSARAESSGVEERLSYQDPLTGLASVQLLHRVLEFNTAQSNRYGRACALLALDVDRFHLINEQYGFQFGDEVIRLLADRLRGVTRGSDMLARKGEDEFLILLSEVGSPPRLRESKGKVQERLARIAFRFLETVRQPMEIQGQKLVVEASAGGSLCPGDAQDHEDLLPHADAALFSAKESGRGRVEIYNPELRQRLTKRLTLENQLRSAVVAGEFRLLFLPIVHLESGQIVGGESLLRWEHPLRGTLAPPEFLDVAEECGIIAEIDRWVLMHSCHHLAQWREAGLDLFVDVNFSIRHLLSQGITIELLKVLEEFGLNEDDLVIDVPESAFAHDERVQDVVRELGVHNIRIAIDDYGQEVSNLKMLRLSKTKILKIARELVEGVPDDRNHLSLCVAAIKMAGGLNQQSLAEGVETHDQYRFLLTNGCLLAQGYYFSPPVESADFVRLALEGNEQKTVLPADRTSR